MLTTTGQCTHPRSLGERIGDLALAEKTYRQLWSPDSEMIASSRDPCVRPSRGFRKTPASACGGRCAFCAIDVESARSLGSLNRPHSMFCVSSVGRRNTIIRREKTARASYT
jgi:hypothetical protein